MTAPRLKAPPVLACNQCLSAVQMTSNRCLERAVADQPEWLRTDLRSFSLCFLRLLLFEVFTKAFGTEANRGNGEED